MFIAIKISMYTLCFIVTPPAKTLYSIAYTISVDYSIQNKKDNALSIVFFICLFN